MRLAIRIQGNVTLAGLLTRLQGTGEAADVADHNLSLLAARLDDGWTAVGVSFIADFLPWPGPVLTFLIELGELQETLIVSPGRAAIALLNARLAELPVGDIVAADVAVPDRPRQDWCQAVRRLFRETEDLEPEERSRLLMDWIMERVEAARCVLVPFESNAARPPLAFHVRGKRSESINPRKVPRQIVAHVASTRQPLVSHDVKDPANELPPEASVLHQRIRSYLAVPVIFHGELLAVAYVDRFDRPRRFSDAEQTLFEAFAYELALPLLAMRESRRRQEYLDLRDRRLAAPATAVADAASPALEAVLEQARRLAPHADTNLLILGETGVGKEVLARYVHEHSGRRLFVPVNVSATTEELFESELMGSARGAFTGSVDREGRVGEAHGGTLFLDEIGDLPLANQVKLLRFLQDKRVTPVGGKLGGPVDVRVIAATNRPLADLIRSGDFRADLYHRFAPPLRVPALRERREEILPLAQAILARSAQSRGLKAPAFTAAARTWLQAWHWPGNIRQLEALVSHALLLAGGSDIDAPLLQSLVVDAHAVTAAACDTPRTWDDWRASQDAAERSWLARLLDEERGNIHAMARRIGCPGTTLRRTLEHHGLQQEPRAAKRDD